MLFTRICQIAANIGKKKSGKMKYLLLFIGGSLIGNPVLSQVDTTSSDSIETVNITVESKGETQDISGSKLVQKLGENEFKKAACCTLAESFELSNVVEVSNSDGVSGIKRIEMLGLQGKYVQMTRNNMPIISGLSTLNGLSNIPGSFVSGVNISKGTGSVNLGYEGITGGIDYSLKTNENAPKLFINGYQNNQGRSELNLLTQQKLNPNLINTTLLHGAKQWFTTDNNKDGYTDMPATQRIYVENHTKFQKDIFEGMVGISHWNDQKEAGEMLSIGGNEINSDLNSFRFFSNESRTDISAKLGIIPEGIETTFGNLLNLSNHKMNYILNSSIGRQYVADENRLTYSGLVQSELSENIGVKAGISYLYSEINESFDDSFIGFFPFRQTIKDTIFQQNLGVFSEWVLNYGNLSTVIGIRFDYHNLYGAFFTPRIHLKYELDKKQHLFLQSGIGRRTALIYAENLPEFISTRWIIRDRINQNQSTDLPYGYKQESAWNSGITYQKNFQFMHYPSSITVDAFYTKFFNQVILDRDYDASTIVIKQMDGSDNKHNPGYVQSLYTEWSFIPLYRMEVKLGYRFINHQQFLGDKWRIQPFQSRHRALATLSYRTHNKWYFDLVTQWNGKKRVPVVLKRTDSDQLTESNGELYSPSFFIFNGQIRKSWNKKFEWYIGSENLLNFKQNSPVISNINQWYRNIDATYSWGPNNGRMFYTGFRYTIN